MIRDVMRRTMRGRPLVYLGLGGLALAMAAFLAGGSSSAGETTVAELARETHFHGLAVDARDADRLYLATHHGFFVVTADGTARRVSATADDYMGFTLHPADPGLLYASGHPAGGGNLGFIVSRDGGKSWSKLADGAGGPVDFHQLDVSKADTNVIYGVHGVLQRSADGGRTWTRIAPPPEGIIALAASSTGPDRLYAATRRGLMVSSDGGRQWRPTHVSARPASMVHVTPSGVVYTYIVGEGLLRGEEPELRWTTLTPSFSDSIVLHLAASPNGDGALLYAVVIDPETRSQGLRVSRDGGRTWAPMGS